MCSLVFVVVYFVLFKDKTTTTKTTLILKMYFAPMVSLGLSLEADFFNLGRQSLFTHCYTCFVGELPCQSQEKKK